MRQFSEVYEIWYDVEDTIAIWNMAQNAYYLSRCIDENKLKDCYIDDIVKNDRDGNTLRIAKIWKKCDFTKQLKKEWNERPH